MSVPRIPAVFGPNTQFVDVTPELAAKWLEQNTHNRHLRERHVASLAGALTRGEWVQNGDAVKFSHAGVLLDGQHRLAAIVQAGVTARLLVVDGLDEESQTTMDTGAKRTFADVLHLRGETYSHEMAALARRIYMWQTGQIRSANLPPTNAQLLQIVEELRDPMMAAVKAATSVRRQLPVSTTVLALCHWLFTSIDADDCNYFFARLRDGEDLSFGSPILALRRFILNGLGISTTSGPGGRRGVSAFTDLTLNAVVIKAWNFYRQGREVQVLKWTAGGASPERFPIPE